MRQSFPLHNTQYEISLSTDEDTIHQDYHDTFNFELPKNTFTKTMSQNNAETSIDSIDSEETLELALKQWNVSYKWSIKRTIEMFNEGKLLWVQTYVRTEALTLSPCGIKISSTLSFVGCALNFICRNGDVDVESTNFHLTRYRIITRAQQFASKSRSRNLYNFLYRSFTGIRIIKCALHRGSF